MSTLLLFPTDITALQYRTERQRAEPFHPLFDRYQWLWCVSWSGDKLELNGFTENKVSAIAGIVNWSASAAEAFTAVHAAVGKIRPHMPPYRETTIWRDGSWQYKE
jgi:hypothetical protein